MKILIAEDESINRRLVKKHLADAGYETVEAEDGQAAWELFQSEPFHFVITDWMMPRLDGPALIQNIRNSGQSHYTYIIILTAMDETENVVRGLESGADDYLTKPLNGRELIARVSSGMRILKLEEQLMQARKQMEVLAMHDGLTGLLNRRAIEEQAEAEFSIARRKERSLSIILLDIDHFKRVNDTHGHKMGDEVLQRVAGVLSESLRKYDRLGRWGGEEFLLILPDTDSQGAMIVAERLRVQTAETNIPQENGEPFSVQISLGVATTIVLKFSTITLAGFIDEADQALYKAKQGGRNQVCGVEL
jgi:two-component system, cell cycle response regulator